MKVDEIEKLLSNYYNGETSESEENELKRFFSEENVPVHLKADKEFFMQLLTAPEVPAGMEQKLNGMIDRLALEESARAKFSLRRKHTYLIRRVIGIAASLLILVSIGLYLYEPYRMSDSRDTCATPEEAYKEAQRALVMFSSSVGKGMKQVEEMQTTVRKVENNINRQLNHLNTIKQ